VRFGSPRSRTAPDQGREGAALADGGVEQKMLAEHDIDHSAHANRPTRTRQSVPFQGALVSAWVQGREVAVLERGD
jgi:hypothetical protein